MWLTFKSDVPEGTTKRREELGVTENRQTVFCVCIPTFRLLKPTNELTHYLDYAFRDFKKICWMIDSDNEREEVLTPEAKKRQKDAAREVVKYCTNISECRRVQVLRHFGQDFDQRGCKAGCDNCLDNRQTTAEDVTIVAINAIGIVQSLSDQGRQITQRQLTEVLRGANSNMVQGRGFNRVEGYGTCKDVSRELVDIALDRLVVLDILGLSLQQQQKALFSAEYLEVCSGTWVI
jgi:superfamily II DNA helicase RecQ